MIIDRFGFRFVSPALAALDLCVVDPFGSDIIDRLLRSRQASLADLHLALQLTSRRSGNADRRRFLVDSRSEPWSKAERLGHRILYRAGIVGWIANYQVFLHGRIYYLDIAFPDVRLCIEIDGRFHEDDLDVFESDRRRQNRLILSGWRVLRFTWSMLVNHPDVVLAEIQAALAMEPLETSRQ